MVYRLYFVFKKHGNVIGSVVAGGIVLTVLMCLAFGMRPYIKENKKINELKYIEVKSSIQNFQLKELPTQILSFFGGPFRNDKIVLKRTITGTKMLKVTLTQMPEGTFYIKNFVGETYKNNKWSEFSLSDLEKDSSGYRLMKEADIISIEIELIASIINDQLVNSFTFFFHGFRRLLPSFTIRR